MTGRVLSIGDVETIPSKNGGEPFKKRVVVLNCTRMDFGKTYENYPSFEFSGKHADDPKDFKVDDIVTVSFVIQGTKYQKEENQSVKYFNTVSGYKIEHHQRGQSQQRQQTPQGNAPQAPPQGNANAGADNDDLPF